VPTKKLLIPVDGSEASTRALKFAAKIPGAALFVLHVKPPLYSSRYVTKAMIKEHQRRGADHALAPARALIKRSKMEARLYTAVGDAASTIATFAKKRRCFAIVMGNRGRGRFAGMMLGSVANKVIYLAACPVTIVK
jgi:nucleotide-binding universal stress UspA family protein